MPSKLTKPVIRITDAEVYDRGKLRKLLVTIEPTRDGANIAVRVIGTRQTYRRSVQSILNDGIRNHESRIEREARRIMKDEGKGKRSATAMARKKLDKELTA